MYKYYLKHFIRDVIRALLKAWNLDCINLSDLIINQMQLLRKHKECAIRTYAYAVELKIRRRDSPRVENSSRSQKD